MDYDLINDFNKYLENNRIPIWSSIQLTYNCNFKCIHCYQTPIKGEKCEELTTEEWINILDTLKDAGCIYLTFTGGEVFTKKDFLDIYLYAHKKNFKISIISNGSLISDNILNVLSHNKPERISITVYGFSNETYDKFTKIPHGFDSVKKNIELLLKNDINVKLQTIANKINKNEIKLIREFAEKNKLPFTVYGKMRCYLNGDTHPKSLQLSVEELFKILNENEIKKMCDFIKTPSLVWHNSIKKCTAGINNVYIDPQGYMYLCNVSNKNKYSLKENTFNYCWDKMLVERKKEIETITYCSTCKNKAICGLCAPVIKNEYESLCEPKDNCEYGNRTRNYLIENCLIKG